MALTGHQRRLLKEIEQIADIAKLDYPQIEKAYAPEARTTILLLMKDKIVRGDVIVKLHADRRVSNRHHLRLLFQAQGK